MNSNNVAEIAALARQADDMKTMVIDNDGGVLSFVTLGPNVTIHSLEAHLARPTRRRGVTKHTEAASFVRGINEDDKGRVGRIYCSVDQSAAAGKACAEFSAVLNPHDDSGPGWHDFGHQYTTEVSPEWKVWLAADGKRMPQVEFATFIEDNLPDVVSPDSSTMLTIARTLEAKKTSEFASATRLDNGAIDFQYTETIQGTAAKGAIGIPEEFVLAIPVFTGDERYEVRARLRYRITNGTLSLWFDLLRPHIIQSDAVARLADMIAFETGRDLADGTREKRFVFRGTPPGVGK